MFRMVVRADSAELPMDFRRLSGVRIFGLVLERLTPLLYVCGRLKGSASQKAEEAELTTSGDGSNGHASVAECHDGRCEGHEFNRKMM